MLLTDLPATALELSGPTLSLGGSCRIAGMSLCSHLTSSSFSTRSFRPGISSTSSSSHLPQMLSRSIASSCAGDSSCPDRFAASHLSLMYFDALGARNLATCFCSETPSDASTSIGSSPSAHPICAVDNHSGVLYVLSSLLACSDMKASAPRISCIFNTTSAPSSCS